MYYYFEIFFYLKKKGIIVGFYQSRKAKTPPQRNDLKRKKNFLSCEPSSYLMQVGALTLLRSVAASESKFSNLDKKNQREANGNNGTF